MIRILSSSDAPRLLARKAARLTAAEAAVRPILAAVRKRGDTALLQYSRRFDGLTRRSPRVTAREIQSAIHGKGVS